MSDLLPSLGRTALESLRISQQYGISPLDAAKVLAMKAEQDRQLAEGEREESIVESSPLFQRNKDQIAIDELVQMMKQSSPKKLTLERILKQVFKDPSKVEVEQPMLFLHPDKLLSTGGRKEADRVEDMASNWKEVMKLPLLISSDMYILDGHHRAAAAKKKGKFVRAYRTKEPYDKLKEELK